MSAMPIIDPEFKALIPPLSEDEYKQLEQNILSARKCRDPILLWDGVIIDGHSRFEICEKHGVIFEAAPICFNSKEEAKIWIIDNQLGRRNLSKAMRIELALLKVEFLREMAKKKQIQAGKDRAKSDKKLLSKSSKAVEDPIDVRKAVAVDAGVGVGTVHRYEKVKENADPELLDKVKREEVSINAAFMSLEPEIKKRFKQADGWLHFIDISTPIMDNPEANAEIRSRLTVLAERLDSLLAMFGGVVTGGVTAGAAVLSVPLKGKEKINGK
jgi:hypothetical protein